MLRCLAKNPEERFPSVASLEESLRDCCAAGDWSESDAAAWWNTRSTGAESHSSQPVERV